MQTMKKQTKAIIAAVSSLLSMALVSGGYLLLSFIIGMLIMSPLWLMVAKVIMNIAFIIYNVIPASERFCDWIERTITEWYTRWRYRPQKHGNTIVYQAYVI